MVRLSVSSRFLPQVSSPQFTVGEADDPMTSWIFGKHGEIFEYSFVGKLNVPKVACMSTSSTLSSPPSSQWCMTDQLPVHGRQCQDTVRLGELHHATGLGRAYRQQGHELGGPAERSSQC